MKRPLLVLVCVGVLAGAGAAFEWCETKGLISYMVATLSPFFGLVLWAMLETLT